MEICLRHTSDIVYLARAIWFTCSKRLLAHLVFNLLTELTQRRLFKKRVMHINSHIFLFFPQHRPLQDTNNDPFPEKVKTNNHFQSFEIMSYLPLCDSRLMTSPWLYNPLIVLCLNNYPADELTCLAVASI